MARCGTRGIDRLLPWFFRQKDRIGYMTIEPGLLVNFQESPLCSLCLDVGRATPARCGLLVLQFRGPRSASAPTLPGRVASTSREDKALDRRAVTSNPVQKAWNKGHVRVFGRCFSATARTHAPYFLPPLRGPALRALFDELSASALCVCAYGRWNGKQQRTRHGQGAGGRSAKPKRGGRR